MEQSYFCFGSRVHGNNNILENDFFKERHKKGVSYLRPCLGQRAPDVLRLYANADKMSLLWFSPAQFNPPRFALGAIGERASDANRLARLFLRFAFKRRQRCPKRAQSPIYPSELTTESEFPPWTRKSSELAPPSPNTG